MIKKLRVKKEFGTWYYEKIREIDMEFDLYYLYNEKKNALEHLEFITI